MQLEDLKKQVMKQAAEKGFGTKPRDIIVSEKIALIHSEISEAYDAYLQDELEGKDGFYEELGDALQRVLHLGGIFGIIFPISPNKDLDGISSGSADGKIAKLHKIVSECWENYRHKKMEKFKDGLIRLAYTIIKMSEDYRFSLDEAILKKMANNKDRKWNKKEMHEKFV